MGSFSQMTVSGYPIFSLKNSYDSVLVNLLFQKDDFVVEKRLLCERNQLIWGEDISKKKGSFDFHGFRQSVRICKQRLEIAGTNLKIAKRNFKIAKRIANNEDLYAFNLKTVTFEDYLVEVKDIIQKKEISFDNLYNNLREALLAGELGIYGQLVEDYLYAVLSCLSDDDIVEYDLSDVIFGGWVKQEVVLDLKESRILVLTEGKTDVEFISIGLRRLYPHLLNCYHFIDFDEFKVESNASALVKLITAFAAVKINHQIIAIFDNDTTGIMEMSRLKNVNIPSNIKVMRLPDIKFAKNYPTIGATGIKKMNVNGLACGIEMYLGPDILEKDGTLLPIHWKSYNERELKYQGEISQKNDVQETFRKKVKSGEDINLSNLDIVLKMIFTAFQH